MEVCCKCGGVFNSVDAAIQNHEPCATSHGIQPTGAEQLKAGIDAYYTELNNTTTRDHVLIFDVMERLRQLKGLYNE